MEAKKWYQSKTVLLNVIVGVSVALVPAFPQLHVVSDFVAANSGTLAMVWAVAGIAIRFITKDRVNLFD